VPGDVRARLGDAPAHFGDHELCVIRARTYTEQKHFQNMQAHDTTMSGDGVDYEQLCQRICEGDTSLLEVVVVDGANSSLVEALTDNSVVKTVCIENAVGLGNDIAAAVSTMSALTVIRLRNVGLSAVGARKLTASPAWKNLRVLDLRGNPKLGPRGVQWLVDKLSLATNLEELNLSNCRMGHFGAKALGDTSLPSSLKVLDLSCNGIGNDGTWKLAPALKDLTNLESLLLSKNQIGDDGASEIGHQLPDSLKILDMRDNDVADVGAEMVAAALVKSRLERLMLANNKIGSPGATALSQVVVQSSSLIELDLNGNGIGDDGAAALAKSLVVPSADGQEAPTERKTASLTTLRLKDNKIGDAGAGAFVEHLDRNRKLVTLDLAGNYGISSARFQILDMILKHRTSRRSSTGGSVLTPPGSPLRQEQSEEAILAQGRKLMKQSSDPVEISSSYLELCTGHFDIQHLQSRGAFGELYQASDDDEDYLIRRIPLEKDDGMEDVRDRALKDVLVSCVCACLRTLVWSLERLTLIHLQALKHDNLLPLVAYSRSLGLFYFVYDYNNDCSLHNCICRRVEMPWKIRLQIIGGVANALDYLHNGGRRSNLHGDVKSANIFVSNEFTARLSDCGGAQLVATDNARFLKGDVVFGSQGYRCPRYERGSRKYTPESDVFSFGIVMAEVYTGRLQNSTHESTGQQQDFYYDYVVEKKREDLLKDYDASAGEFDEMAIATVCNIAVSCMDSEPMRRPGTSSIVKLLDSILKR